jgi:uncharacterized membrane protein
MQTLLQHLIEKAQASVWTTPALFVVLAIIFSQVTLALDRFVDNSSGWFFISSSENAITLLSTIATSSLSLAGLSFSSIMVTMSLASGQFGPRLLRNFMKDRSSGVTLGTLMGTYTYCLFIIRGPRANANKDFVPQISSFVATACALASLAVFIHFVQHILIMIQAENVISDAHAGLQLTIQNTFPELDEEDKQEERVEEPSKDEGWSVPSGQFGYVQAISFEELVTVACSEDLKLYLHVRAGDFLTREAIIVRVLDGGDAKESPSEEEEEEKELIRRVQACVYVGQVRTSEQDYEYGIRQLVEIALRALSPGINDPFTAIDCIDYLGSGLQTLFQRQLPKSVFRDANGTVRLIRYVTDYRGLLGSAVDQIRQAARTSCAVSGHLLQILKNVALCSKREDQRRAILEQATLIERDTLPALFNAHDKAAISKRYEAIVQACRLPKPVGDQLSISYAKAAATPR